MLNKKIFVGLFVLLFFSFIFVGVASAQDNWVMFHHDAAHTGSSTSTPSTGQLLWKYTTGGLIDSSPAVSDGVVYIGSNDGNVYALNAATGAQVWSFTTGGIVYSSPAVVSGVVYIGSYDGNVYALNAATGAQMWSFYYWRL